MGITFHTVFHAIHEVMIYKGVFYFKMITEGCIGVHPIYQRVKREKQGENHLMRRQIKKKALFTSGLVTICCLILILASFHEEEFCAGGAASDFSPSEIQRQEDETCGLRSAETLETSTIVYSSLPWTDGNSNVKSWILLVLFVFVNMTLLYRDDKRQRIFEKKEKAAEQYIRVDR